METKVEPKRYFRVLEEYGAFSAGNIVELINKPNSRYDMDYVKDIGNDTENEAWFVPESNLKETTLSEGIKAKDAYGSHYAEASVQAIEAIQANMPIEAFVGYLRGNIIKYACRLGRKDKGLQ